MARNKYNKKNKKTPKKTVRLIKPKKRQTFEKKVLSVIHKQAENKEAYITSGESSLVSFNSAINVAGDMLPIVPGMVQGTASNQRIGDKIMLQTHTIKGYFRVVPNLTAGSYKFGNVGVRMMVLSFKNISNYDNIITDPTIATKLAGLLQKGGTTVGFTGLISDLQAPINRDLFTVHYDKVYHIKQDYVMTAVGTTTQDTLRFFNIKLRVKNKQLKYTDDLSSGLLPSNHAPILCLGYSYMDGSLADSTATNVQLFYESIIRYEDM